MNETAKNAARERTRVKSLRDAFSRLQSLIPNVPPDTKLSKLDVLILASSYIRHLTDLLNYHDKITTSPGKLDNSGADSSNNGNTNLHAERTSHSDNFSTLNDIAINCNNIPFHESADGQSAYCSMKNNSLVESAIATCSSYSNGGNKYLRPVRVSG